MGLNIGIINERLLLFSFTERIKILADDREKKKKHEVFISELLYFSCVTWSGAETIDLLLLDWEFLSLNALNSSHLTGAVVFNFFGLGSKYFFTGRMNAK